MGTPTHFTVLTPYEFIEDVKSEAEKATKRVWAQAMDVEPGEISNGFFAVFQEAAKKGIDTRFHADCYSLMVTDGTFNYWPFVSHRLKQNRADKMKVKKRLAYEFQRSGAKFLYTNAPSILDRLFPVRGRNHMKIVIIDDTAWVGGVNFTDDNFLAQDVMVKLTDRQIVQEIAYVFEEIDEPHVLRDMAIHCTDETTLLVDGGRINRSIILRRAVALLDSASTSIKVVSPLIPDADLLYALQRAQSRGVTVQVIAPHSRKMGGIYVLLDEFNGFVMRFRGIKIPISFKSRMIHAKILIVDDKEVIVGSHNFSSRGVRMGTEEIALQSTNKQLTENLLEFYHILLEI
jgi:cardiolipin synthase A/B